jgi:hypothetical protein
VVAAIAVPHFYAVRIGPKMSIAVKWGFGETEVGFVGQEDRRMAGAAVSADQARPRAFSAGSSGRERPMMPSGKTIPKRASGPRVRGSAGGRGLGSGARKCTPVGGGWRLACRLRGPNCCTMARQVKRGSQAAGRLGGDGGGADGPQRPTPRRGGDPLGRRHGPAARLVLPSHCAHGVLGKQPPC